MAFEIVTDLTKGSHKEPKLVEPKQEAGYTIEDYDGELSSTYGVQAPSIYIARINEFTGDVMPYGSEMIRWDSLRNRFILRRPVPIS